MGTNDLLENLSVKRKSCRKVVEIRMDRSRLLDVIICVFEGKSSMDLREGAVWGACCRWFESSHPDAEMEGVRCKNLTPSFFVPFSSTQKTYICDCNLHAICEELAIAIATFMQIAQSLQLRLQPSCNLRGACNCDCSLHANCAELAIAIATFMQIARNLQLRLQPSCKLRGTCNCDCSLHVICAELAFAIATVPLIHEKAPSHRNGKRLLRVSRSGLPRGERLE